MDWQDVAPDFEPDGSLRDIHVFGADLTDWQRVLDVLRKWEPPPHLTFEAETAALPDRVAALPDRVEDIFAQKGERGACLSFQIDGALVNCHFSRQDEIEFDLDGRDVTGSERLEAFGQFMALLARITGKPVVMTMECHPEMVILRCRPDDQRLEWVPPPHG